MQIFPDSQPRYVTAVGSTGEVPQASAPANTGLFGGCGFLGLFPSPPKYVGTAQPTSCPETSLFGVSEPRYVQATTTPVARRLPESTGDKDKEKAR